MNNKAVTLLILAGVLIQNPSEWRYIPRWIASHLSGSSPLDRQVPWLPYAAVKFLEQHLNCSATVFEFGSGGSTIWFARRAKQVISVEHNRTWYTRVRQVLNENNLSNVTLLLREPKIVDQPVQKGPIQGVTYGTSSGPWDMESYATAIDDFDDASFDVVLVDGRSRAACLVHAIPKVRPGGLLILDDSERKRYSAACELPNDWPKRSFHGLRPSVVRPTRTTCWFRPDHPVSDTRNNSEPCGR